MAHLSDFTHSYIGLDIQNCHQPMQLLFITPRNNISNNQKKFIIVIQEIFGINDSLKQICASYAAMGYYVLCPDLFHRFKAGINLTDTNPDDLTQAFDYFNRFNIDTGITDIQAVIDYAKNILNADSVGAVGYCLGGFLSYLTACRTNIDASVAYYGVNIHNHLNELQTLQKPLILHIAANDEFVPADAQDMILTCFESSNLVKCYRYQDVSHAFARINGTHFNKDAASVANQRTQEFFTEYL
jgi:carboxymethylenebutenolidase